MEEAGAQVELQGVQQVRLGCRAGTQGGQRGMRYSDWQELQAALWLNGNALNICSF